MTPEKMKKINIILFNSAMFNATGESPKQRFIGDYLNMHMKGHNYDFDFTYLNLLAKTEEKAEIAWKKKRKSCSELINKSNYDRNRKRIKGDGNIK